MVLYWIKNFPWLQSNNFPFSKKPIKKLHPGTGINSILKSEPVSICEYLKKSVLTCPYTFLLVNTSTIKMNLLIKAIITNDHG